MSGFASEDERVPRADTIGLRGLTILVVLLAGVFYAVTFFVAGRAEQDRLERIENAEERYGLNYLRSAKDGEGTGMWRTLDGRVISCQISGVTDDPELDCDADPIAPQRPE